MDNPLLPKQKYHLKFCLNELKVCKVSRNPKSKRCWKFQLSILRNKKVLFLKKIWSVPCTMDSSYFSQKMATWRPNFPHLWLCLQQPLKYRTHVWFVKRKRLPGLELTVKSQLPSSFLEIIRNAPPNVSKWLLTDINIPLP